MTSRERDVTRALRPVQVYSDDLVTLHQGDCLDVLREMPDDSVDAVVTDPPYGLEFMGKGWDGADGFRRSLNAADTGRETVFGRTSRTSPEYRATPLYQEWCEAWARECLRVLKPGGHMLAFGGTRTAHRLASAIEDAGFEIRDTIAWLYGSGFPKSLDVSKAITGTRVTTAESRLAGEPWRGWGTALKPANEPIIVARKSPIGTVAANVLTHGTGALNIDGCRVEGAFESGWSTAPGKKSRGGILNITDEVRPAKPDNPSGRWPTNVVLDPDAAAELDAQTGTLTSGANPTRRGSDKFRDASRFFPTFRYEAKAPTDERPKVGTVAHPTVKPLDLMRWLVRLVTPPGGVVLEPFAGSGTTAEACIVEGFRCIAIEREADYLPLILARITKPIEPVLFGEGSA